MQHVVNVRGKPMAAPIGVCACVARAPSFENKSRIECTLCRYREIRRSKFAPAHCRASILLLVSDPLHFSWFESALKRQGNLCFYQASPNLADANDASATCQMCDETKKTFGRHFAVVEAAVVCVVVVDDITTNNICDA